MSYHIVDDPVPSRLNHLAVQPFWPLLAVMFGGVWLSFPWFVLNAQAIGCPNRKKTLVFAIVGVLGCILIFFGIAFAYAQFSFHKDYVPYAYLLLTLWKLGIAYKLFLIQSRTFELYQYFDGRIRNGFLVIILSFFLQKPLFDALPKVWSAILG